MMRFRHGLLFTIYTFVFMGAFHVARAPTPAAPLEQPPASRDNKLPDGWQAISGHWSVENGALIGDAVKGEGLVTFGNPSWQNYEITVRVTFLKIRNESRWLSVVLRAASDGTTPWSQVPVRYRATAKNGTEFAVRTKDDRWSVRKTAPAKTDCRLGITRELRVLVRGNWVHAWLDGQPVIESPGCVDRHHGCVGLAISGCVARFERFTIRHLRNTPVMPRQHGLTCEIVAHRGYSSLAPENTLAAISEAIAVGAQGCEFDVRASREGTVVLLHDDTVDRTTDGRGKVKELTLAQLKTLDAGAWKHSRYKGERVPTLDEALRLLRPSPCRPVVEIKTVGISGAVVESIRAAKLVDRAVVIAFNQDVVREVRVLEPRLKCAWLHGEEPKGSVQQQADWLATEAAKCRTDLLDLNYKILSPELVKALAERNVKVWTWTVNEQALMAALTAWGVQSITTDRPDLILPAGQLRKDKR